MIPTTSDEHEREDLMLYVVNDGGLYRAWRRPIEAELSEQHRRGFLYRNLALFNYRRLVSRGVKKYRAEFSDTDRRFTPATQDHVARELLARFMAEAELGNYTD